MKQAVTSCQQTHDMYFFYARIQVLEQQWKNAQMSMLTTCRSDVYHLLNMCHVYAEVRTMFWISQCLLSCCHKMPHTNNHTSPHTINILNTHSRTGHCDSPCEVRNSTLWRCSHVLSWEMNNVTARQDVSSLETSNMSKNTELIKWNNFLYMRMSNAKTLKVRKHWDPTVCICMHSKSSGWVRSYTLCVVDLPRCYKMSQLCQTNLH
jgi:hypothetical protein